MTNAFNFLSIYLLKARNYMVEIEQPLVSRRQRILKCTTQTLSVLIETQLGRIYSPLLQEEREMIQILCYLQKNKSL